MHHNVVGCPIKFRRKIAKIKKQRRRVGNLNYFLIEYLIIFNNGTDINISRSIGHSRDSNKKQLF